MPLAKSNGIKLNYEIHGEGFPVVLIGGLGSQISSWDTQVPLYSEKFKVITFDNRGVGKSDKPDYRYTIEMMADDTVGLLDFLGIDKAHVIGKSMGGMVAQWIGIKYPERVDKIVMGCSSASRDKVGNLILQVGRDVTINAGPRTGWLLALFLGYSRKYIEKNLESITAILEEIPESAEGVKGYLNQSHACEKHDVADLLEKIRSETLVMYGENDLITSPERSQKLADLIPGSKQVCFKNAGHGFWRECQSEVDITVLEFLESRSV